MTNFERLVQAHVQQTTLTTISQATEKLAEEMARELLRNPAVRAELQELVLDHFTATVRGLRQPPRATRPARKAKAGRV